MRKISLFVLFIGLLAFSATAFASKGVEVSWNCPPGYDRWGVEGVKGVDWGCTPKHTPEPTKEPTPEPTQEPTPDPTPEVTPTPEETQPPTKETEEPEDSSNPIEYWDCSAKQEDMAEGFYETHCATPAVTPTTPPAPPQLCGPSAVEGAVGCDTEITWETLAYIVGNPDPGGHVNGVSLSQYQSGAVYKNGEPVAPVKVWESVFFPNRVSYNWFYEDVTIEDHVQVHLKFVGWELWDDVEIRNAEDGLYNPSTSAMLTADNHLLVFPGQSPENIVEVTQYNGETTDQQIIDLWQDAHLATQRGESTEIPSDLMAEMGIFEIHAVAEAVYPPSGVYWEVVPDTNWGQMLIDHGYEGPLWGEDGLVAQCGLNDLPLKAGWNIEVPQCVVNALPAQ